MLLKYFFVLKCHFHQHLHIHNIEKTHDHKHPDLKQGIIASLSVGFIHGLAGVAHFLLFLPVIVFSIHHAIHLNAQFLEIKQISASVY